MDLRSCRIHGCGALDTFGRGRTARSTSGRSNCSKGLPAGCTAREVWTDTHTSISSGILLARKEARTVLRLFHMLHIYTYHQ